jgi:4-amino-4-deoxy-L-arabinose transferase-like glycosyltransferase
MPTKSGESDFAAESSSPTRDREARLRWWWLALILALGLGLRVDALRQGTDYGFNLGAQSDAMEAYEAAVSFANGEPRAQYLGQPNFNIQSKLPGPLWTAFCAAGLKLFGTIEGAAVLILLTGTGAIFLTYLLALRAIGGRAALWAALLQATSPLAVQYSIVVFNPAVMPFLGGLFFLALWRVAQRDRSRSIFWVGFLLLIMPQFHFSSVVLAPAAVVVWWLSKRRLSLAWLSWGVMAGAVCYVPYIYGEIAHHWQNTIGMTAGSPGRYSADALKAFIAPLAFLYNDWSPRWAYTTDEYREICRACFGGPSGAVAANILSAIMVLVVTTGAGMLGVRAMRGFWRSPRETFARSPGVTFLFVALLVPLICAVLLGQPFHPRYALMLLAPLFGLTGAAVATWIAQPRVARIVLSIVCAAMAVNIWYILRIYRVQDEVIETTARFIPTFRRLDDVYQTLQSHAGVGRIVELQDGAFERGLSPQEAHSLAGAELIRRYINVRNREIGAPTSPQRPSARYVLRRGSDLKAGDPSVVYHRNGIAIVAETFASP